MARSRSDTIYRCCPLVIVLAGLAGGPQYSRADDPPVVDKGSAEFRKGYARGWAEAEAKLQEGGRVDLIGGDAFSLSSEYTDRETGLPLSAAGCLIDDEWRGRIAGNNERIADWIKTRGLPANSVKPWERQVFDIAAYFAECERRGAVLRLTPEGSPYVSPDGRLSIAVEHRRPTRAIRFYRIWLTFRPPGKREELGEESVRFRRAGRAELCWGPAGSPLAFLRFQEDGELRYVALDTRDPWRPLREE